MTKITMKKELLHMDIIFIQYGCVRLDPDFGVLRPAVGIR